MLDLVYYQCENRAGSIFSLDYWLRGRFTGSKGTRGIDAAPVQVQQSTKRR
jgi:hypothetical protein